MEFYLKQFEIYDVNFVGVLWLLLCQKGPMIYGQQSWGTGRQARGWEGHGMGTCQADHRTHPEGQVELQNWNIERSKALTHQLIRFVGHHLAQSKGLKKNGI